jgi:hypothetical protein
MMAEDDDNPDFLFEGEFFSAFADNGSGGFNKVTIAFKRNPTIEHYLELRKNDPDAEIEVSIHGGVDQLFYMEPELARYGISADEFVSVFDADDKVISKFSLFFMEKIVEARRLAKAGETHLVRRGLAVPDKLIDWFITCSLDAMSYYDVLEINRDLIVLIRERLGGPFPEYEVGSLIREKRQRAAIIAGCIKAQGRSPSLREIASLMKVAPTTVMRWFGPGEFDSEAGRYARWFNPDGSLRDLRDRRPDKSVADK